MNDPYQNPSHFTPIPTGISLHQDQDQDQGQDRDRVPQWTEAETKELLSIRAELDQSFTETKRNKPLWEAVSSRMQRKGFIRTPEKIKSKWKNLVTRYKSSEAMEGDQKFPFHEEMRTIFSVRMERLHRLEKGKQKVNEEEEKLKMKKKRKKKEGGGAEVVEALREVMRRHVEMEKRWMEAVEEREAERRRKEDEWRREMVALQEERMAMERWWKEREDERQAREEERDERRHDIVAAIITKVFEKGSS